MRITTLVTIVYKIVDHVASGPFASASRRRDRAMYPTTRLAPARLVPCVTNENIVPAQKPIDYKPSATSQGMQRTRSTKCHPVSIN
ncbi:jg26147 [Pararge aegeria aegeria]|uniref:Jg26147 protein n=1 Tax=Pararge aegeria aegeria TaxID=348720 RepID=A0A8S4S2W3_9NEOP|nr:jg26147 [Pararge aegeria aegeria]